ncbi:hypothetical protein JHY03_21160 [Streptomyces sp. CA-256286]|nr:hypothetical protein JHY03_21160 [Streptomyces sp. CA-256286]
MPMSGLTARSRPRFSCEGHLAEAVEAAADLFLGHFQATGEIGHTVARIRQHRTVYGFRLSLHTQRSQHARPP